MAVHLRQEAEGRRRVAEVAGEGLQIYWEFGGGVVPPVSERGDFAAIAFLPLAMSQGRDLRIHQPVDHALLANLEAYQEIWCRWAPEQFRPVRIMADEELMPEGLRSPRQVVAAFSGGVDATFAVAQHHLGKMGRRNREVAAGVMVHGFDIDRDSDAAFSVAADRAQAILKAWNMPLARVKTNWRKISVNWPMTHVAGIAAVLHQYRGVADGGLVAYDYPVGREPARWGNHSITDPLLSAAGFPLEGCGGAVGRTEKCAAIGVWPAVRESLRVCWEGPTTGRNCGRCEKCLRTKLNFLAAGIGAIPALPGALTVEDVERLKPTSGAQLSFLEDILAYDAVHGRLPPEIRQALASRVEAGPEAAPKGSPRPRRRRWFRRGRGS